FLRAHSVVPDLPVAVSVRGFARVAFGGAPEPVRATARAMMAHLATFHAPEDLRLVVCAGADRLADWEGLKWLPHALHPSRFDATGPVRLLGGALAGLEELFHTDLEGRSRFNPSLPPLTDRPHLVFVVDGGVVSPDSQLGTGDVHGVTVLDLSGGITREPD